MPRERSKPAHPGAVLRRHVLQARGLTQSELAARLHAHPNAVHALLGERARLSPDMAVRLERLLGDQAEKWMQMQVALDLWQVRQNGADFADIEPLAEAARREDG